MNSFKNFIYEEQKKINSEIDIIIHSLHSSILPVVEHIFSTGGKRLRPILLVLFAEHFGYTHSDVYRIASSVELIHSATLLHDDIIDSSSLRRGIKTAHTLFGITQTVLAGDALLAKGCNIVAKTGKPELLGAISELIMETVHGEIQEIASEGIVISLEEYIDILRSKTAFLLRKSCEMGAIVSGASKEEVAIVGDFGESLGIAFQIVDDILDYSPSEDIGKPRGIDIEEGKITAPILFYAQTLEPKEQELFLKRLVTKDFSAEEREDIIVTISSHNAIDKTYNLVQEYLRSAVASLDILQNTKHVAILRDIVAYTEHRKY